MKATASAPGKAILFGEHAVVYGVTAVAAALSDLRITVTVVSRTICLILPQFTFRLLGVMRRS